MITFLRRSWQCQSCGQTYDSQTDLCKCGGVAVEVTDASKLGAVNIIESADLDAESLTRHAEVDADIERRRAALLTTEQIAVLRAKYEFIP